MRKKVLDITSPNSGKDFLQENKAFRKRKGRKMLLVFLVGLIFVGGVGIYLTCQSKAEILLYPRKETLIVEDTAEFNVEQTEIDLENKILPAFLFEKKVTLWKNFPTEETIKKEGKARGRIVIYNKHTPPQPLVFRKNTRFLSSKGEKIFRCPYKIYIPAATFRGKELIPGKVEVEVEAQEPGEEYNIPPSKFSIPGLSGTSYYYNVWAESTEPMKGGFKTEVKVLTSKQIEKAKEILKKELFEKGFSSLKNESGDQYFFTKEMAWLDNVEIRCFQEPGAEVENFSCEGSCTTKGLAIKREDLRTFANFLAQNMISSSEVLVRDCWDFLAQKVNLIKEKKKMVINLKMEGKVYKKVIIEKMLDEIKGKKIAEVKEIISGEYPEIEKINIHFWPFWVNKVPKNLNRIKIRLIP